MRNKHIRYSIVFPIMNQADHIASVIRAYHRALTKQKISFELIAVVNGSTDASFRICKRIAKTLPNTSVYEIAGKGYGLGILYGLARAKGEVFCYLNCARIQSADLLSCLKQNVRYPHVIIHGVRRQRHAMNRSIGSFFYNTLCRVIFHVDTHDINGNPNIFSRQIYQKLQLSRTDSMIDLELHNRAKTLRIPVVEVAITSYLRMGGHSTTNVFTIFRLLKEMANYYQKNLS